jgi:hypothetical protein
MNPNDDNAKLPEEQRPPLIWQCRYGGIEVPNDLWKHCTSGKDRKYSDNQAEDMIKEDRFMASLVDWVTRFESLVSEEGKVPPNKYRAFGYKPPRHLWANVQDGIRYFRMMVGNPPKVHLPQSNSN